MKKRKIQKQEIPSEEMLYPNIPIDTPKDKNNFSIDELLKMRKERILNEKHANRKND